MGKFVPGPLPSNVKSPQDVMRHMKREMDELARGSGYAEDVILPYLNVAPSKVVAGMIVLADGVNWDPGSGEGAYRRNAANNAWVFLG